MNIQELIDKQIREEAKERLLDAVNTVQQVAQHYFPNISLPEALSLLCDATKDFGRGEAWEAALIPLTARIERQFENKIMDDIKQKIGG